MRLFIMTLWLGPLLFAEDKPKPTVEELQQQLAAKDRQIAVLNENILILATRHDNIFKALNACFGPIPQLQKPENTKK